MLVLPVNHRVRCNVMFEGHFSSIFLFHGHIAILVHARGNGGSDGSCFSSTSSIRDRVVTLFFLGHTVIRE